MSYGPRRTVAAACVVAAAVGLSLALTTSDHLGRLLYALAAVVLLALGAVDLIWNPRLVVDGSGMLIRRPGGSRSLSWNEIDAIRVDEHSRHGLASRALEIDTGDDLIILSQRVLGVDPRDVVALASAFRPS